MTSDDGWVEKRRRWARVRAVTVAVLVLGAVGWYFFTTGQEAAEHEVAIAHMEQLVDLTDFDSLKAAATESGQILFDDERAPGDVFSVDVRSQLLVYVLYTGADGQRSRAKESLQAGKERAADDPRLLVAEALVEALEGSPDRAIEILDGGGPGEVLADWQAAARAEALMRKGELEAAAAALSGRSSPVARTWAIRVAWRVGDLVAVQSAADALIAAVPKHQYAMVMSSLAAARSAASDPEGLAASIDTLGAMLETGEPLTALNAALVTAELSRMLRRSGKSGQADELLQRFLAEDETSLTLQAEVARSQCFQGLFGAAKIRSDKALRARADDPELLAELAQAAFFNDSVSMIRDRARQVPEGSEHSDGVVRALALASLLEGNTALALAGLDATRHLGIPGESELWLAEAHLRANAPVEAAEEAVRAAELLAVSAGPDSREVAMARMYEGLAVAVGGDIEGGEAILAAAFVKPNQTPWGAWVYGRFHEVASDQRSAKDAYFLACDNGHDFALSCFDLARIYDALPASEVMRSMQQEAREQYLRTSSQGLRADEVRAALGQ